MSVIAPGAAARRKATADIMRKPKPCVPRQLPPLTRFLLTADSLRTTIAALRRAQIFSSRFGPSCRKSVRLV
jgi:hypothetical protein